MSRTSMSSTPLLNYSLNTASTLRSSRDYFSIEPVHLRITDYHDNSTLKERLISSSLLTTWKIVIILYAGFAGPNISS